MAITPEDIPQGEGPNASMQHGDVGPFQQSQQEMNAPGGAGQPPQQPGQPAPSGVQQPTPAVQSAPTAPAEAPPPVLPPSPQQMGPGGGRFDPQRAFTEFPDAGSSHQQLQGWARSPTAGPYIRLLASRGRSLRGR